MTTFIMKGRYSADALKRISAARTAKANKIVRQCKGRVECAYATLGDSDVLVIAEFPGVSEAIKASVGLAKVLGISFATTPAICVEEFDKLLG